ncbi:hypothetical protein D9B85_14815 [Corynebacterium diphtheriae]|nr:hypothetical protein D9B85_14815 [Corynebacterium diphtheriae]
MSILLQITLILVAALLIVPITRYLKLPAVLGYLLTGLVLGSERQAFLNEVKPGCRSTRTELVLQAAIRK